MIDPDHDPQSLTWLARAFAWLFNVDCELLARSAPRDRTALCNLGFLVIAAFIWQGGCFTFAAHSLIAEPGEFNPWLVGCAVVFAIIIAMTDVYIISNITYIAGVEQMKRGGLELPGYTSLKIKNGVQVAVRLGLAVVYAVVLALSILLYIFRGDVHHQQDRDAALQNVTLEQQVGGQYDADTNRMSGDLAALQAARVQAGANAEQLRADALRVPADDPELAAATARVGTLEAAKLEAERRLAAVPREAATRRYVAQRLLAARRTDHEKAQKEQEALRKRADGSRQTHGTTVATRLKEATAAEATYQARITALEAVLVKRAETRAASIRTAMEQDARYVPPERGILSRVRVLARITEDGSAFALVLLLHIALIGIELAAVLVKVLSSVPSSYAVQLAGDEYATEVETVNRVFKRIGALGDGAPPAPDDQLGSPTPALTAASDDATTADAALDTEERLRDGARAAQAQAAARAKAKERANAKARDQQAAASDAEADADATPVSGDQTAGPVRRGPGRPPGARNKPKSANDDAPGNEGDQDAA